MSQSFPSNHYLLLTVGSTMKENSKYTELQSFTAVCQKLKKNPPYCWNISLVDCLCFRLAKESEGRGRARGVDGGPGGWY